MPIHSYCNDGALYLEHILFLEYQITQHRDDNRTYDNYREGPCPFFHAVGDIHAEETADARGNHQDDGYGCQAFHDYVQVVRNN